MSNPQYIKLRNGVIFDAMDVCAIARADINQYLIFLKSAPAVKPHADADEVAFIESVLGVRVMPEPEKKVEIEPAS